MIIGFEKLKQLYVESIQEHIPNSYQEFAKMDIRDKIKILNICYHDGFLICLEKEKTFLDSLVSSLLRQISISVEIQEKKYRLALFDLGEICSFLGVAENAFISSLRQFPGQFCFSVEGREVIHVHRVKLGSGTGE